MARKTQPSPVPRIKKRLENVVWTEAEAQKLKQSADRDEKKLGEIIEESRSLGWTEGKYQVFLLTRPEEKSHITLEAALKNSRAGKNSAYVRKQRYASSHRLQHISDLWNL
ncbi:hypothetical protein [Corynebacterium mayonis]|uniref:hypothetical protein n=1 Tax=Corynebacterium mayonis TaxID=3062461 RepID=UPI00313FF577